MKASAIVCAVLAGTFGFSTLATAQDRNGRRDDNPRAERRDDRRDARREQRAERRDDRQDRRQIQAQRQDRQENRAFRQGYRQGVQQPTYVYRQPSYTYQQPRYYSGHRFQRGSYLPHQYRQNHYYVNDWRSHRGLYAPPHGHQWMQVGSEFVLVALATGLIANLLMH